MTTKKSNVKPAFNEGKNVWFIHQTYEKELRLVQGCIGGGSTTVRRNKKGPDGKQMGTTIEHFYPVETKQYGTLSLSENILYASWAPAASAYASIFTDYMFK